MVLCLFPDRTPSVFIFQKKLSNYLSLKQYQEQMLQNVRFLALRGYFKKLSFNGQYLNIYIVAPANVGEEKLFGYTIFINYRVIFLARLR